MHVISLYLILHAYVVTFDVICVKKTEAIKRALLPSSMHEVDQFVPMKSQDK
jgi:hypothetical protein